MKIFTPHTEHRACMDYLSFLTNQGPDYKGRTLSTIRAFTHTEMESYHDYIQVVFPTDEPSWFNPYAGYLNSPELIAELRDTHAVKINLVESANWFLHFLAQHQSWCDAHNHNQLRITRVIKSLRLLVSDDYALTFHNIILGMLPTDHRVSATTLRYWEEACPRSSPAP